ncbi:MAG: phosphate/phosphite/phosphonate ABC transporter substrate-binding protein [Nitrospiraceae bacterium]|nr:MAG: phosphate/phosphite/phosphonate ABC transporter substrate-binding protein [Nitrospiraceae bacterium]
MIKIIISAAILFICTGSSIAAELKIGLIPEQNVFKQFKRYEPLGTYIEKKTGHKIKYTTLSRYGNIIESFHKKKMDGAFWGSFTGAMAIEKLGIHPIARPVNFDGTSTYHGYILVHKDSGIKDLKDMKGRTVAFVEQATTAGYIFPIAYFREQGIKNIDTYFKEYYFTGSHDSAIHAVLNKKVDIACAKNTMYEVLSREDPRIKDELVIIARSPDVPSNGLGLRKELAYGVKAEIRQALVDMHLNPEGREVLKNFGVKRFIETNVEDYAPVFDIAERAGIDLKKYEYVNK